MDQKTLEYYDEHADEITKRWEAAGDGIEPLLPFVFRAGQRVLDIGSGSGRNLAALRKLGAEAVGIEPSESLRKQAMRLHPQLAGRIVAGSLPDELSTPGAPKGGRYDGILLSAVIMHLPDAELFDSVCALRRLLADGGALLVSFPTERGDTKRRKNGEPRDEHGRLMVLRPAMRVRLLFERLGFVLESEHEARDGAGRPDVRWTSFVFRCTGQAIPRAADRIERILHADRKTATYGLALVRALCDLASTAYNTVTWSSPGKIGIPLGSIADLWVRYYWPLFEPERIIPQVDGESKGAKPVAFRRTVTALIDHYRGRGGLSAFHGDLLRDSLEPEAKRLRTAALRKVGETIVKGPLEHEAGSDSILIDAELWREIVVMAHWVKDAVILRWAEMTAGFARVEDGLSAGGVLQRILESSSPLRSDHEVRFIFEERLPLECVWSGKTLSSDFAVDRALPFALWQDGSWWNLFPSTNRITGSKSGKLPTLALVRRRREAIVSCWELVRRAAPGRFARDAGTLTGRRPSAAEDGDWQTELFSAFVEAIEFTAASRSAPRWEP